MNRKNVIQILRISFILQISPFFLCSGVYLVHENKVTNSYPADENWVDEKYPEKKLAVEPQGEKE